MIGRKTLSLFAAAVAIAFAAAAIVTVVRGWTGIRFATALTTIGLAVTIVSGLTFLAGGPRPVTSRHELDARRSAAEQDSSTHRRVWVVDRPLGFWNGRIAIFLAALVVLGAGVALGFALDTP